MSFVSPILKNRLAGRAASLLIGFYIRLVDATSSWRVVGIEHVDAPAKEGRGAVLAFWHARLLMAPTVRRRTSARVFMLISNHRDGDVIADAVAPFGVEFIRGSAANPKKRFKDKSGASALVQMIAALEDGGIVGLTPDGPRGPAQEVQPGVARVSRLADVAVLPASYATSRGLRLNTWDRFWLPLPFSRGVYVVEPALSPPRSESADDIAAFSESLKSAIDRATERATRLASGSPSDQELR
ncbi:MAG: lysophospholipid acyltransferase family protein [Pseudomonadota bacterium]